VIEETQTVEIVSQSEIDHYRRVIGDDLEKIRKMRGMTKGQVIKQSGLCNSTIYDTLKDGPRTIDSLVRIANALRATMIITWAPNETVEEVEGD